MSYGIDAPEPVDQVARLITFENRHRDVIITRPTEPLGRTREPWRAERFGEVIASHDELRVVLDDLDALGLPEVLVCQH